MTTLDEALNDARKQIDIIDDVILESLNQRAKTSLRIAEIKQQHDPSLNNIIDSTREQVIIKRIINKNNGPLSSAQIEALFTLIIEHSRELQLGSPT